MTLSGHDGGGCREEEPNHKQTNHDQMLVVLTGKEPVFKLSTCIFKYGSLPLCPPHASTHVMNDPRPLPLFYFCVLL